MVAFGTQINQSLCLTWFLAMGLNNREEYYE